jgi:hypothetical protein
LNFFRELELGEGIFFQIIEILIVLYDS